jgi:ribosome-binding ATPase
MKIGLVGLPLTGKTTFFNLLTGNTQETGLTTGGQEHEGTATVPDKRMDILVDHYKPKKITYAQIHFKDIPGFNPEDAHRGRSAAFLDDVRPVDALVIVVRAFHDVGVDGALGEPNPYKELLDCCSELLLADISMVENRIRRLETQRKPNKETGAQVMALKNILAALEEEKLFSQLPQPEGEGLLAPQDFLTEKPLMVAVNVDEEQFNTGEYPGREKITAYAGEKGIPLIEICGQAEMEISQLPEEDRLEFMEDLHLEETGMSRLARAAYSCLGLISFFTVGEDEVRAWTVPQGITAKQAAGKIHSDIERGFIRAEVFHFADFHSLGSALKVKEKGLFRLEGKEYIVKDGDMISFRFHV